MSDISDIAHRKLMKQYIERLETLFDHENLHVEIEKPYNYYGQRGFIDIFYVTDFSYNICEVKSNLDNFGEAIRQLKKVYHALYSGMTLDYEIVGLKGFYRLLSEFNEYNYNILINSYSLLKNVGFPLGIQLFCEKSSYWFGPLWPKWFQLDFILKNGDQLKWRWEHCQKGLTRSVAREYEKGNDRGSLRNLLRRLGVEQVIREPEELFSDMEGIPVDYTTFIRLINENLEVDINRINYGPQSDKYWLWIKRDMTAFHYWDEK